MRVKKLKVLHIISSLGNGGAENILFQICAVDQARRHRVIGLGGAGIYGDRLTRAGVSVTCLHLEKNRNLPLGIFRLKSLIKNSQADLIQTWMYHSDLIGGISARLAGRIPVIWGVRASDAFLMPGYARLSGLVKVCAAVSRLLPSRIIFNSGQGAQTHIAQGYPAELCEVVHNGVDSDYFSPDPAARIRIRRSWNLTHSQLILGTVARWDSIKNHALLAEALHALKATTQKWHAVWIGPGMSQYNRELIRLLDRFSIRQKVSLLGPTTDLKGALNGMDLHVLPSRSEGFPNVLAEAMACKTPCVATSVGDARQILGETGWTVPSQDPQALAQAMREALSSMKNRRRWLARRTNCRIRVISQFGIKKMIGAYDKIWTETVGHEQRRKRLLG